MVDGAAGCAMEAVPSATLVASRVGDDLLLPTRNRRLGLNESDFGARRATTPRARGRHGDPGGRDAIRSVPPRGARGGYARDAIERCVCDGARPTRTPMSDLSSDEDARARPLPSNVPRQPPSSPALTSPPSPTASIARRRARGRERRGRRPPAVIPPRASSRRPRGVRRGQPRIDRGPRGSLARHRRGRRRRLPPTPRRLRARRRARYRVRSRRPNLPRRGRLRAPPRHVRVPPPPPRRRSIPRARRASLMGRRRIRPRHPRPLGRHPRHHPRRRARAHPTRARQTHGRAGRSRGNRPRARPRRRMGSHRRARVLTPETHRETRAPRGGWRRG